MIVRNIDGIIKVIDVAVEDQDAFLAKNPTGGFMKVDDLPYARYGNWKMSGDEIVVDEAKEAEMAALQYRNDRTYPSIEDQLDMLWHAIDTNETLKTQFADFYNTIKTVKDQFPKPE